MLHLLRNSEICRGVEFLFQSVMIILLVLSAIQSLPRSWCIHEVQFCLLQVVNTPCLDKPCQDKSTYKKLKKATAGSIFSALFPATHLSKHKLKRI